MEKNTATWSKEDFLAFLMIHAASSDAMIDEDEKEVIIGKVGGDEYKEVSKTYKKMSDFEATQAIAALGDKFYPNKEDKQNLLKDLNEVVAADDHVFSEEATTLHIIKKLI